jgi:HAD superfamily hydrolase (TIGR01509 family)
LTRFASGSRYTGGGVGSVMPEQYPRMRRPCVGYQSAMIRVPNGVLFDVDGTLVETPYLHAVCWWEALQERGHDVPMAHIHRAIGMGSDKIVKHLTGTEVAGASDGHHEKYRRYWDRLRPTPGAADLVRECKRLGLTVALASSANKDELAALRKAIDVDDAIDHATSADDADQSKPAPDILEAALSGAGLRPEEVVFVGDSVWDVYACAKLDIPCIGLTCGGISAAELREAGAVEVYADPVELLRRLPESALTGSGALT